MLIQQTSQLEPEGALSHCPECGQLNEIGWSVSTGLLCWWPTPQHCEHLSGVYQVVQDHAIVLYHVSKYQKGVGHEQQREGEVRC